MGGLELWLLSHPETAGTAKAVVFVAFFLLIGAIGWLIALVRGTYMGQLRISAEGVGVQRGKKIELYRFETCSRFTTSGIAVLWSSDSIDGPVDRRLSGPRFGLGRQDVRSLGEFLNVLRDQALARRRFESGSRVA